MTQHPNDDRDNSCPPVSAVDLRGHEWAEWYGLSPQQRWRASEELWATYLALGGSLDPEPDTQSPFFDAAERSQMSADGRSGVRVIRRSGV